MRQWSLRELIFFALCCDLGLFSKKIIAPAANLLTDALHIPGGIGTSFSLMFLVVAAAVCPRSGCGLAMGIVQSVLALSFGMVGSMGALSPIGYVVPGLVTDLTLGFTQRGRLPLAERTALSNALASVSASLTANWLVFKLWGPPLWLYLAVALTTGALCGMLGGAAAKRLTPILGKTSMGEGEPA